MQTHILNVLDFALNYADEWRWAVFPLHSIAIDGFCTCGNPSCKSEGKHPKTHNGVKDASLDQADLTVWFAGNHDSNIGIATGKVSNLIVVDIDTNKGADWNDLIFGGIDATIFNTPKVKTGAGYHYYYKLPIGSSIKNSANKLGKFIDIRGDGGYVVAPPSKHISGSKYEFVNSYDELLDFPKAWIDKLASPVTTTNGNGSGAVNNGPAAAVNNSAASSPFHVPPPDPGLILPDSINQGTRNVELTKIAGALRNKGLSEGAIFAALNVENQRICKPPLDDKELHQIAHSVGRYTPQNVLNQVSDAQAASGSPDYENTLTPYLFDDFLDMQFEEKEILGFHIGKRDIAIIQAATNAGKTTLLRNTTLCMAAGRPFMPFYDGGRPVKCAYFDFENDAQDVQRDLREMFEAFNPDEARLVRQNLIIIPKGLMDGELFQFNTHEKWANELILKNGVEFIIVDNVSAAYDLNDENSNAEVTKKVIKPLLKMAYKGQCAFLFAHHYGKAKNDPDQAGVHAGRGASALQSLSRTVINMFGDVSKGEVVNVECAKRKTDGGQNYREVFKLEPDRWFHHTTIVAPPKKRTAYQAIRNYMESVLYPNVKKTGEIIVEFEREFTDVSVRKAVSDLFRDGFLDKSVGGYSGKPGMSSPMNASPDQADVEQPPPKNFYEKDDD